MRKLKFRGQIQVAKRKVYVVHPFYEDLYNPNTKTTYTYLSPHVFNLSPHVFKKINEELRPLDGKMVTLYFETDAHDTDLKTRVKSSRYNNVREYIYPNWIDIIHYEVED